MLPAETLDKEVVVNDGGVPRRILRARLYINWKDGKPTPLDKSRFNEFTLRAADMSGFIFNNESQGLPDDGSPALAPTPYSKAINAYNEERDRVARAGRWSGADLTRLQGVCEQHRDELERGPESGGKTLALRVEALLNVVRQYPALFSGGSN